MKLAFEEHGNGKPLLLIHAFPFSKKMWSPQINQIVRNKFRLILPDLRGFGQSHLHSFKNTMEEMALDIAGLLETLKIERAIIGGLSMGGYVTLNLFRLFPEKFAGMILCDTTHLGDSKEKQRGRFKLIDQIEQKGMEVVAKNVLPNLLSEHTREFNENLLTELGDEIQTTNQQATIAALRGMAERKDHTDILKQIKIPTLLIFGEDDKITDIENATKMAGEISDSELKILRHCGHLSNLESPSEFNEALIKFIKPFEI